jgi:hypothetical protein
VTNWQTPTNVPHDGESVWAAVREWDGKHFHVDYGVVFYDTDGPIVRLFERKIFEHWPAGIVAWMPCEMPEWSQSNAPPMPPIRDGKRVKCPGCKGILSPHLPPRCPNCLQAIEREVSE